MVALPIAHCPLPIAHCTSKTDVIYDWQTSRSNECLLKMLTKPNQNKDGPARLHLFRGNLQCDGHNAYKTFARKVSGIQQIQHFYPNTIEQVEEGTRKTPTGDLCKQVMRNQNSPPKRSMNDGLSAKLGNLSLRKNSSKKERDALESRYRYIGDHLHLYPYDRGAT